MRQEGPGPAVADSTARCRRLAAELHDGTLQDLFAAQLDLDEALEEPVLWGPARDCVERAASRVRDGATRARALLLALGDPDSPMPPPALAPTPEPAPPQRAGSDEAVRDCVSRFQRRSHIDIDLLLRVLHEGLANVVKHAEARRASVRVQRGPAQWVVEVHDDGTGDPRHMRAALASRRSAAFGLHSLREDARDAHGQLWAGRSRPLGGAVLGAATPTNSEAASSRAPAPPPRLLSG
jgi:signal transduction histidine kinase